MARTPGDTALRATVYALSRLPPSWTVEPRDVILHPSQKLQYLHNVLYGDANRYYLDKVDGYASSFQQAVSILEKEYNSPVRQTRVKNYLNSLRVSSYITQGVESSAALSKIHKSVIKLSRQAPRSHQGDAHKVEFLCNAIVGMPWSNEPLSRVATHNLTFQKLYAELEAALQLDKEAALANLRDSAEQRRRSPVPENTTGVLYTGQDRYMNDPTGLRRTFAKPLRPFHKEPNRSSHPFEQRKARFDPLSVVQGCFNCGGNHLLKDCLKPLNTVCAASRNIEYFAKKKETHPYAVHQVFAELCE